MSLGHLKNACNGYCRVCLSPNGNYIIIIIITYYRHCILQSSHRRAHDRLIPCTCDRLLFQCVYFGWRQMNHEWE